MGLLDDVMLWAVGDSSGDVDMAMHVSRLVISSLNIVWAKFKYARLEYTRTTHDALCPDYRGKHLDPIAWFQIDEGVEIDIAQN